MDKKKLTEVIKARYEDVIEIDTYGEQSFFYNPDKILPKGVYFATIKEHDGPNDKASNLDRDSVYRLNIGVGKTIYEKLFGLKPARPAKGGVVATDIDFTQLNEFTPHPVYAWLYWIAIISPEEDKLETVLSCVDEAYRLAQEKFKAKVKNTTPT